MNSCFEKALKNYIKTLSNEKEGYCMNSNNVNFKTLTDYLFASMIVCNKIVENVDYWVVEIGGSQEISIKDISQFYIVDIDCWNMKQYKTYLKNHDEENLFILYYDCKFNVYVLGVIPPWCNSSWSCVPTSIKIGREC